MALEDPTRHADRRRALACGRAEAMRNRPARAQRRLRRTAPTGATRECLSAGRGALEASRDVAADEIAERVDRVVRDPVVHRRAAAFALDQPLLHQLGEMARDVGRSEAAKLGELADVALAGAEQVEDLQARRLRQRLEVGGHLIERLGGKSFHSRAGGSGRARIMPHRVVH